MEWKTRRLELTVVIEGDEARARVGRLVCRQDVRHLADVLYGLADDLLDRVVDYPEEHEAELPELKVEG